ncbi:MAG: MBL fold metallo-hydrolase [Acidimicrobiia bacterium]|nr:MBL fold metallo-hydrolase [Acidimicrobiia bacterium]
MNKYCPGHGLGGSRVNVTFFGVRGSTPCSCDRNARYGGNTSSVVVEAAGSPPILLDLGTGVRFYGESLPPTRPLHAVALVTHLHWDHVQGLPFFSPVLRPGSSLQVYAPDPGCGLTLEEAFAQSMRPPYFPVPLSDLRGDIRFHAVDSGHFSVGEVEVTVAVVPHNGPTLGFRLDWRGRSIAFIPDHQQPLDGGRDIAPAVVELAQGVDLLIHDAQYTQDEFRQKRDWGHSTVEYAVEVGLAAKAGMLALFHHDPTHDDGTIDRLTADARAARGCRPLEVLAAHEGLTVALADQPVASSA